MIKRIIKNRIEASLFKNKVILLYGARQTGKTTLVKSITSECKNDSIYFNGDISDVKAILSDINPVRMKSIIGKNKIVVIDEAQTIPNIGVSLKIMVDEIPDIQIIATGSSSFELADQTTEPLTGRKYEFKLFPFSHRELSNHYSFLNEQRMLYERLVYGSYPEIITNPDDKIEHLRYLAGSYLYKDILMLEKIKKPVLLEKIIRALALQIGSEVNYNEIAQLVKSDYKTVEKYIDLLCKTYVIFILPALNRNVRNEITKGRKIYFWDNGIRNAAIGDYNILENRTDVGALWENYLISERIKLLNDNNIFNRSYFWRTTQQQEIDYIEENERGDSISAWEFKWNSKKRAKFSKTFTNGYADLIKNTDFINQGNYTDFIST
jgi:uncharacterized protein